MPTPVRVERQLSLKARVLDDQLLELDAGLRAFFFVFPRSTEANAPQSWRANAQAANAGIALQQEDLQNVAAREQAVNGVL